MNEDQVRRLVEELTIKVVGRPQEATVEAYNEVQIRRDTFKRQIWQVVNRHKGGE